MILVLGYWVEHLVLRSLRGRLVIGVDAFHDMGRVFGYVLERRPKLLLLGDCSFVHHVCALFKVLGDKPRLLVGVVVRIQLHAWVFISDTFFTPCLFIKDHLILIVFIRIRVSIPQILVFQIFFRWAKI